MEQTKKNVLLVMDDKNYLVIKEANSFLEQLQLTMDSNRDALYDVDRFKEITEDEGMLSVINENYSGVLFLNSNEHVLDVEMFHDANKVFEENKDMDDEINELFGNKENFQQEISRNFNEKFRKQKPFIREQPKISNNTPCLCGSGKKYKKCCKIKKNLDPMDEHLKFIPSEAPMDGSTGLDDI